MNGSFVNDKLIKGGQTVTLSNGDLITFGQDQQPYIFEYGQEQRVRPAMSVLDDKVSLVPKAYPTYARIDHLASPQISYQSKVPVIPSAPLVSRRRSTPLPARAHRAQLLPKR